MPAVVVVHGCGLAGVEGVEDADGVGFVGQVGEVVSFPGPRLPARGHRVYGGPPGLSHAALHWPFPGGMVRAIR